MSSEKSPIAKTTFTPPNHDPYLMYVRPRIEANPPADELRTLLARKSELRRLLAS